MNIISSGLYVASDAYWRTKTKTAQIQPEKIAPVQGVQDSLANYGTTAERERRQQLYLMKNNLNLWPNGNKKPTRALKVLNQQVWDKQDWNTIEVLDDTRKMWGTDPEWFDETKFEFDGFGKTLGYPFKPQPLSRKSLYRGYLPSEHHK